MSNMPHGHLGLVRLEHGRWDDLDAERDAGGHADEEAGPAGGLRDGELVGDGVEDAGEGEYAEVPERNAWGRVSGDVEEARNKNAGMFSKSFKWFLRTLSTSSLFATLFAPNAFASSGLLNALLAMRLTAVRGAMASSLRTTTPP
jgi:hypothetical protein